MSYKKCERLLAKIDSSFREYGKNRVFLIGDNLKDIFLYDMRVGALNIIENLKLYVRDTKEFTWLLYLKSNGKVKCFKKEKDKSSGENKVEEKEIDEFFKPKMNTNAKNFRSFNDHRNNKSQITDEKSMDEEVERATEGAEDQLQNRILNMIFENNKNLKALVYIEDFDWLGEFYDVENNNGLIKKVLDMDRLKNNLVVLSLKTMQLLEDKFFQKYDDNDVIKILSPSKKEIELLLHRISWKMLGYDIPKLDYDSLSAQCSNSNYSLRECAKILRKKIKKHGDELILADFEFKTKVEEKIKWDDVILAEDVKKRIDMEMKDFIKGKEEKKKGLILTGPPGTGKTFIAKAMATEGKVYFMCPKLSDLKAEFVGQSAPKVKELFEEARANEPTLIFLDELDTLFPKRDSTIDGDSYTKDITNEFLQQLDGVNTGTQKIYVLGATNRIESIDPAVRSRLGMAIEIGLPEIKERKILFEKNLEPIVDSKFWTKLSPENSEDFEKRSEGMSGRDIKNLCVTMKKSMDSDGIHKNSIDENEIYERYFNEAFRNRKTEIINTLRNTTGLKCLLPNVIPKRTLFGIDKQLSRMKSVMDEITLEKREIRKIYKLDMQNGILLYGPPGNGKTELIEMAAKAQNMMLIKVESKDFIGYTPKDTLNSIDDIFSKALNLSRMCDKDEGVVLFFDEFDSLVGLNLSPEVRGTILVKLSDEKGVRANDSQLIVAGATNFYWKLDEATTRAGRFDCHIELGNPEKDVAFEIIENLFEERKIYTLIQLKEAEGEETPEAKRDEENRCIEKFYDVIKKDGFEKYKQKLMVSYGRELSSEEIEKEEISYAPSASDINIMIRKLQRFLVETQGKNEIQLKDQFDLSKTDLIVTEKLIENFEHEIV